MRNVRNFPVTIYSPVCRAKTKTKAKTSSRCNQFASDASRNKQTEQQFDSHPLQREREREREQESR